MDTNETTVSAPPSGTDQVVNVKLPRRIIHCSDGVVEEYSTDEETEKDVEPEPIVDPATLTWPSWFKHYIYKYSLSAFYIADKCGEKIAWFLGITAPKYQREINEYYRLKALQEQDIAEENLFNINTDRARPTQTEPTTKVYTDTASLD